MLALLSSSIDIFGKSSHVESEVHFMDSVGVGNQCVELPQEGPVYGVDWSPTGVKFIIIYGYMPASATSFNDNCEFVLRKGIPGPEHDDRCRTISWSLTLQLLACWRHQLDLLAKAYDCRDEYHD